MARQHVKNLVKFGSLVFELWRADRDRQSAILITVLLTPNLYLLTKLLAVSTRGRGNVRDGL